MRPLAIASCAVLTLFALVPPLAAAVAILFVSGVFDCFQVAASAAFVTATPPEHRSQAFGIAQAGMSLGQGTMMLLAGAAAESYSPASVIAVIALLGAIEARSRQTVGAADQKREGAAVPHTLGEPQ